MTISGKIRIYDLSRDLNLENKDVLEAAQKLSISVKSHSSSISADDAERIKGHIRKARSSDNKTKGTNKTILSVNKSTIKTNLEKNPTNNSIQDTKSIANQTTKRTLIQPPINPPKRTESKDNSLIKNIEKPIGINNLTSKKNRPDTEKGHSSNKSNKLNINNPPKPIRPPIQLVEKPNNNSINKSGRDQSKLNLSTNNRPNKVGLNQTNFKGIKKPTKPELVGAPIRKENPVLNNKNKFDANKFTTAHKNHNIIDKANKYPKNKQKGSANINRDASPNRQGVPNNQSVNLNRQGVPNNQSVNPNRPSSPNRPVQFNRHQNRQGGQNKDNFNRSGFPNRGGPNRPSSPNRQEQFNRLQNRTGPEGNQRFNPGVRRPVAPGELMQLQKPTKTGNLPPGKADDSKVKPKDEKSNQVKAKSPIKRANNPNTIKKAPHRGSLNQNKKSGKSDWDDAAKLEALRNKTPQKQRQKVHIIGENEDSLTTQTSGFASGKEAKVLSASLARPAKPTIEGSKKSNNKKHSQHKKRKKESTRQRQKRRAMELKAAREAKQIRPEMIIVPDDNLTVQQLADKLSLESSEIIKSLFFKGITATVTQSLDLNTIETVAEEFGVPVLQDDIEEAAKKTVEMIEDQDKSHLITRPPVVTVMGHVDHGKTSLLDAIRKARVASGEAGGITQHIGAYQIDITHEKKARTITFLDTPGHEAFTAMRARGTKVTDIAILVVAADDGVRPQTMEAISHARAAKVPILVAINKIDKEGASPDRVKQELSEKELIAEDWGGDVVMVSVSATKSENIDKLLEMILLVSEVEDLQANPERLARGTVIEAHLDKAKGPVATLLVQNGTLRSGDVLAAGSVLGKIRAMVDENGSRIKTAGPSCPVEALGFSEVPTAGDEFEVYSDEKSARAVVGERSSEARATKLAQQMASRRVSLASISGKANEGDLKELNLILKADVQGSIEAILGSLEQLPKNEVQVRVLFSAPGEITETDVDLAAASGSVIIGFNTSMASGAKRAADANEVEVKEYEVIYKLLEDIQSAMEGLLEPDLVEEPLGEAEVRATFTVGKGAIAGCYVKSGKLQRNCKIRVTRKDQQIFDGDLDSLRRTKEDVKEVNTGFECGVGSDRFSTWEEGDLIEAYKLVTQKRKLNT
tara:strand:+ start:9592 stop:13026 length:3435 start_codon:yes stop_codon:yes gene_type:complete